MLTAIVLALYLLAILLDLLPNREVRPAKANILYVALLGVSFVVLLLHSLDIPLPGPSKPIQSLLERYFPLPK